MGTSVSFNNLADVLNSLVNKGLTDPVDGFDKTNRWEGGRSCDVTMMDGRIGAVQIAVVLERADGQYVGTLSCLQAGHQKPEWRQTRSHEHWDMFRAELKNAVEDLRTSAV